MQFKRRRAPGRRDEEVHVSVRQTDKMDAKDAIERKMPGQQLKLLWDIKKVRAMALIAKNTNKKQPSKIYTNVQLPLTYWKYP